tara:strand:+ start:673 stop:900 length:228 start_codon:yes stop_codon:yes gene_type:complete
MSVRKFEDKSNKHLPELARNTISILGQTIGHIKRHPQDANIMAILTNAITMLTSIIKPYTKNSKDTYEVDTSIKN